MSEVEFLAVIGGISAILIIADTITDVYKTVKDIYGLPKAFSVVASHLLAVQVILKSAERHISATKDEAVCMAIKNIVAQCKSNAEMLKEIFEEVKPTGGAWKVERYYKAVKAKGKGKEVEALMMNIWKGIQLLDSQHGMETATKDQQKEILAAIKELSEVPSSVPEHIFQETGLMANNSGSGTQNTSQGEYIAQGSARQYNAPGSTMHFDQKKIYSNKYNYNTLLTLKADEVQTEVLWLSPLNFWAKQDDTISRRETGTCEWIFKEAAFIKWRDGAERILWCSGMPGAVKTVLTSVVIDHLQSASNDDIGIAFIYSSYKEREQQTLVHLTASLLQQLFQRQQLLQSRPLPAKLHSLYQTHTIKNTRPTVTEYLEFLRSELFHYSRVFLIVDALDECNNDDETRNDLISELLNLPTHISLMVTSRHVLSIKERLKHACRLEIRATDTDIRIFLERQIRTKGRLPTHIQREPSLMQDILNSVVKTSQGMFLLAQLHIEAISQKQKPRDVRTALKKLLTKLDETYSQAMKRIRSQNEDDSQLAQRVLTWISFALRPLTVTEIRHAIAIGPDQTSIDENDLIDEDIVVSVCTGLVVIDQESEVIRLTHYTTQEYFDRNRKTEFLDGQIDITKSSLTYLLFEVFESGYCNNDELMEERLQENPLFLYAVQNWGNHVRGDTESILQAQILQLFAQNQGCLQWDKLCSYLSITTILIEDVDLNQRTDRGETALHQAVERGREAVVRLLLDKRADIEAKSKYGATALTEAARAGHETVVWLLLDKEADVEAKENSDGTAFIGATRAEYKAIT